LDILESTYQGATKVKIVKLQTLRRDFETLEMKESESIDQYMTRVTTIVNQLKTYGEDVLDQKVVEKVLITLSKKFDSIVATIEEAKDLSHLFVDELMGSLLSHESRINRNDNSLLENAFKTHVSLSRGRGRSGRGRS
jgi:hypothetical protein